MCRTSGLAGAIQAVVAERRRLIDWIGHGADFDTPGALDLDPATVAQDLQSALALDHTSPEDCAPVLGLAACQAIIEAARALGQSVAVADRMAAALEASGEDAERLWHQLLFTTAGEPKKADKLVARKVAAAVPDFPALVEAEQARLMRRAERDRAEQAIAATVPLLVLSWQVLSELEAEKRRRGVIDYDDQIAKAHSLVQSASAAAWVRFKLDEGIDHVMVDEAQDTSPAQWDLVDALVDEFFAGAGARGTTRTLFVVGDEKQSIYSFQGAAPRLFADKRAHYGGRAEASGAAFHAVELAHSFRSAPQVLSAVDRVFAAPELARSVGAEVGAVHHEQIKEIPGGVDIWPLFADTPAEESDAWDAPFDRTPDDAGHVKLVKAIADQIAQWMTGEGPDGGPPVTPGDILILSRKREPFATLMNRELKRRFIPAAGADRLDVTAQIAVRDMVALTRALITRDDLSLASVLRSPLFGFTDEALFAVAYGRDGSLLAALQTGDAQARNAHATLSRWRAMARTMRPFDFLAAILLGEGRRADFAARMGSEAEDALDAFLDMALGFEARGIPALETFLHRLERTNEVLRRSADSGANTVRVMTVHGAKGLEARVVFLADVGSTIGGGRAPTVLPIPHDGETWTADLLLYCPTREHKPAPARHVTEQRAAAEAAEHHRLLYVGMTRAEQTLVVCGSYGKRAPQRGMWHALVREALAPECREVPMPGHEEPALLWRTPEPAPHPPRAAPSAEVPAEAAPDWLITPAHLPRRTSEPIVPSDAEGTHETGPATTGAPRALDAARHGALVHDLLENAGDPAAMADRVRRAAPDLAARDIEAIVAEVAAVLALPELSAQTVRREVDLIGDVRMDGVVAGRPGGSTVCSSIQPGQRWWITKRTGAFRKARGTRPNLIGGSSRSTARWSRRRFPVLQ